MGCRFIEVVAKRELRPPFLHDAAEPFEGCLVERHVGAISTSFEEDTGTDSVVATRLGQVEIRTVEESEKLRWYFELCWRAFSRRSALEARLARLNRGELSFFQNCQSKVAQIDASLKIRQPWCSGSTRFLYYVLFFPAYLFLSCNWAHFFRGEKVEGAMLRACWTRLRIGWGSIENRLRLGEYGMI